MLQPNMSEHPLDPIEFREPVKDSRRLWWFLLVLVVVVPPAIWAFYYEPLEPGTAVGCPDGAELAPATTGTDEVCLLPHTPGETFTHAVAIANTGSVGMNVAGAGFTEGTLLTVTGAHLEQQALPAQIPSEEQRELTISVELQECVDQDTNQLYTYTELPVTQSLGPIRKEIRLELTPPIALDVRDCD